MGIPEPNAFLARINEVVGMDVSNPNARMTFNPQDREACKGVLLRLRTMQRELRLVKQEISSAVSALKSEFATAKSQVGKGFGAALTAGFFGKGAARGMNASEKDHLRRRQHGFVEPYERLKLEIDRIIGSLDAAKAQIEFSPEYQIRAAPTAAPRSLPPPMPPALPIPPAPPLPPPALRYFVFLGSEVKGPFSAEQISALRETYAVMDDT